MLGKVKFSFRLLTMIMIGSIFLGCDPKWSVDDYYGRLISGKFPGDLQPLPNQFFHIHLENQAGSDRMHHLTVRFTGLKGENYFEFNLSQITKKGFEMHIPSMKKRFHLKRMKRSMKQFAFSQCYSHSSRYEIIQCLGDRDYFLELRDQSGHTLINVQGGVFEKGYFNEEPPRKYRISEVIERSLSKNFQSLIEYEEMLQAGLSATTARANLLPHFRAFNAIGLITMAPPVLLVSLSDWFPFFFPNRWMMAADFTYQAKAAEQAFSIMQANLATQAHSLSYVFSHDLARLKLIEEHQQQVSIALEQLEKLHAQNKLSLQSLKSFGAYREQIDLLAVEQKRQVNLDRRALSETLGLMNPVGVEEVILDEEIPDLAIASPVDSGQVFTAAYGVALERRQLYYLKKALIAKTLETSFNWMDPTGSPYTAMGLNLVPQALSAQSKLNVLELKEAQFEQKLRNVSEEIASQSQGAKNGYRETLESIRKDEDVIQESWALLQASSSESPEPVFEVSMQNNIACVQLISSYERWIHSRIQLEMYKERWDLSQVRLKRLLLSDLYQRLQSKNRAGESTSP